ncbi:hypothetical protein AMTRI_Chr09g33550 [Amborella trichopoda]
MCSCVTPHSLVALSFSNWHLIPQSPRGFHLTPFFAPSKKRKKKKKLFKVFRQVFSIELSKKKKKFKCSVPSCPFSLFNAKVVMFLLTQETKNCIPLNLGIC